MGEKEDYIKKLRDMGYGPEVAEKAANKYFKGQRVGISGIITWALTIGVLFVIVPFIYGIFMSGANIMNPLGIILAFVFFILMIGLI